VIFRGAYCDTDHCLVVAKVRAQKLEVERFNIRKLSDLEVGKQYQILN